MKMFVCPSCSNAIEKLAYPQSYRQGGNDCCGACGTPLVEREITVDERDTLKRVHQKWIDRTVIGFEAVVWLLVGFFSLLLLLKDRS